MENTTIGAFLRRHTPPCKLVGLDHTDSRNVSTVYQDLLDRPKNSDELQTAVWLFSKGSSALERSHQQDFAKWMLSRTVDYIGRDMFHEICYRDADRGDIREKIQAVYCTMQIPLNFDGLARLFALRSAEAYIDGLPVFQVWNCMEMESFRRLAKKYPNINMGLFCTKGSEPGEDGEKYIDIYPYGVTYPHRTMEDAQPYFDRLKTYGNPFKHEETLADITVLEFEARFGNLCLGFDEAMSSYETMYEVYERLLSPHAPYDALGWAAWILDKKGVISTRVRYCICRDLLMVADYHANSSSFSGYTEIVRGYIKNLLSDKNPPPPDLSELRAFCDDVRKAKKYNVLTEPQFRENTILIAACEGHVDTMVHYILKMGPRPVLLPKVKAVFKDYPNPFNKENEE